ncbi:very low-density lipoprotein receptor-like [Argiope bruennichi]|uniref:very low-density lipoprotein receptor-like n=1 Tax=Argiope bruennichi TaxID=94029 RepID=UPI00249591D7|nr:very low-density lipoprotein receptor-like [Argiope bruennichi]
MKFSGIQSLFFSALWMVVSTATSRDFYSRNDIRQSLRLGDSCRTSSECSDTIQYSHCDSRRGVCTCLPYHFKANNSACLRASLLGYSCEVDGQCQVKVANSRCSENKVCQCKENFLPLRMDKCLPPAPVGQYCVNQEHCEMSDPNSRCQFIVPGIYGKCECPLGTDPNGKCAPGLSGRCHEDSECQLVTPLSVCREGECQCLHGRQGEICTEATFSEISSKPVSLGKPCLSHTQCEARDPNSRCIRETCECMIDTPKCSSRNTQCLNDTFQCTSGQCISWYFVCDGEKNCLDGTDEENCTPFACPSESFQCNDGTCLSRSAVCNGRWECPDGSDEARCYTGIPCDAHSFRCASGQCVPAYAFCNAVVDCLDGSDEDFAVCERGEECPKESFQCGNGRCRSTAILCSGLDGCGDNTDEDRCNVCRCEAPE